MIQKLCSIRVLLSLMLQNHKVRAKYEEINELKIVFSLVSIN